MFTNVLDHFSFRLDPELCFYCISSYWNTIPVFTMYILKLFKRCRQCKSTIAWPTWKSKLVWIMFIARRMSIYYRSRLTLKFSFFQCKQKRIPVISPLLALHTILKLEITQYYRISTFHFEWFQMVIKSGLFENIRNVYRLDNVINLTCQIYIESPKLWLYSCYFRVCIKIHEMYSCRWQTFHKSI